MQLIGRHSFEIQAGNRNYQFILNSDSPIDEFLQVLVAVHQHYTNVKAESEKQKEVVEEPPKEG
jgi:hypothetical protein